MSLFFVNAPTDPARQFFLNNCNTSTLYEKIVTIMRRYYNSETRKLQLQSEMDSPDLAYFMCKKQISDSSQGLIMIVNHVDAQAPEFPGGFGNDFHMTRYLR